jgi:hypothetical protein
MKFLFVGVMAGLAAAVLSGCDWQGADSDAGGYVQRYNWVRFDGTYSAWDNAYLVDSAANFSSSTSTAVSAASGEPVYSMTVQQAGNALTMIDNNGGTYSGLISTIVSTGGQTIEYPDTTTSMPANGDTLTASFEVEGRSSSGMSVKIVGNLSGIANVTAATATTPSTMRLTFRWILGTWIEANGITGAVAGQAP